MIRYATPADTSAIIPIFVGVLHAHAESFPSGFKDCSDPSTLDPWLSGIFSDRRARTYVAVEAGMVVGYLFAMEIRREESPIRPPQHYFSLEHVAVLPEYRRRGIASALLLALISEANAKQIARIELDLWSFNETARHFFVTQGFNDLCQHTTADVPNNLVERTKLKPPRHR